MTACLLAMLAFAVSLPSAATNSLEPLHDSVFSGYYYSLTNTRYHLAIADEAAAMARGLAVATTTVAIIAFALPLMFPTLVTESSVTAAAGRGWVARALRYRRTAWGVLALILVVFSVCLNFYDYGAKAAEHRVLYQRWNALQNDYRDLWERRALIDAPTLTARIESLEQSREAIEGAEPASFDENLHERCSDEAAAYLEDDREAEIFNTTAFWGR